MTKQAAIANLTETQKEAARAAWAIYDQARDAGDHELAGRIRAGLDFRAKCWELDSADDLMNL